ncbi:MAG TPA: energy-coupling factor transporter transmembrane component T [Tissierellaceae bacterium]|nr:energy-coupling factor transporter transmembrane component T [Tissierellaceae bacterium]
MKEEVRNMEDVYPLFILLGSLITFFIGLSLVRNDWFVYYLLLIIGVYLLSGYFNSILRLLPIVLIISTVVAITTLVFATMEEAKLTFYRFSLFGISAIPTLSMNPINLVRVLNQNNFPRGLNLGLLISLRFTSKMKEEIKRIYQAMKLRGIHNKWYKPEIAYRAFLIPLMIRIINISDTMALSLETRAFNMNDTASNYKIIDIQMKDIVYIILILSINIIGIIINIRGV